MPGCERFSTHTTRHLCLTDLARMGWELHAISAFAGHRATESTLRYIHLSGRDLADKLNRSMDHIHAWRVEVLTRMETAGQAAAVTAAGASGHPSRRAAATAWSWPVDVSGCRRQGELTAAELRRAAGPGCWAAAAQRACGPGVAVLAAGPQAARAARCRRRDGAALASGHAPPAAVRPRRGGAGPACGAVSCSGPTGTGQPGLGRLIGAGNQELRQAMPGQIGSNARPYLIALRLPARRVHRLRHDRALPPAVAGLADLRPRNRSMTACGRSRTCWAAGATSATARC